MSPAPTVYAVTPEPAGADDGYRITRDGHFVTWHEAESDALLEAVQLAVDEATQDGVPTIVRAVAIDGRIKVEQRYPAGGPQCG